MTKQRTFNFTRFYDLTNSLVTENDLAWLIGFAEGDGSFIIRQNNQLIFKVIQSSEDIQVLKYIQNMLGFGQIKQNTKTTHCDVVSHMHKVEILISLFNGIIVTPKFYQRFHKFVSAYNSKLINPKAKHYYNKLSHIVIDTRLIIPSLNDAWLSGFTDAEGCFHGAFRGIKYQNFRYEYSVGQKGTENKEVIENIRKLWKVGEVYYYKRDDHWTFRCRNLKEITLIIPYFQRFPLQSKKKISFYKWVTFLNALINKDHLNRTKKIKLIEFVKTINKTKKKSRIVI